MIVRLGKAIFGLICLFILALTLREVWPSMLSDSPAWLAGLFGQQRTLSGAKIGIIAGHRGFDSGAVCPDGLTEASVNLWVAERVVTGLEKRGATVLLLDEYDIRLDGFHADALVSIHADSCEVNLTGFKVAGSEVGPPQSDALADCLWEAYAPATGLPRNADTITEDMRSYHAFRRVSENTPAAIIEIGFLGTDGRLLRRSPERPAAGIIAALECFLNAE